jgi:hypothetical protein
MVMAGRNQPERRVGREQIEDFVNGIFEEDVHAKRVASLANGVDGVLHAASLGVRAIGQGLATAQGLAPRHAIKQVDRLLSNPQLSMESLLACWVRFVVGERQEIFVNFDWTEFEDSDQSMVVLGMQTSHGRSPPLVWKTVTRSQLRAQRNEHEDDLLVRLAAMLPGEEQVTVVADRGFGDSTLYRFLTQAVGFEYLIRFRGVITVEAPDGERRKAREWVGPGGRMRVLRQARVTAAGEAVPVVVCVQERGMKDAGCLATSRSDLSGSEIKQAYGRRFSVEETFRDLKNPRLGLGLKQTVVKRNDRRDALFLLAVLAHALLTLLGKAGRELGMERWLGASRPGGTSLFRQGLLLYELIPAMREDRLRALLTHFDEILRQHVLFTGILGLL